MKLKHGDIVTVPFASGTQAAVVLYTDGDSVRVLRYAASRGWFNKTTDRFSRACLSLGHKLAGEVRRAFRDHGWMGRTDCDGGAVQGERR